MIKPSVTLVLWLALALFVVLNNLVGDTWMAATLSVRTVEWYKTLVPMPYAAMLAQLAVTLTYLGHIDRARSRLNEALSEAHRLRHAHTLAFVLSHINWIDTIVCSRLTVGLSI